MKYFRFYSRQHGSTGHAHTYLGLTCFYDSNGVKYGTSTSDNCIYSQLYVYNDSTMQKLFNGESKGVFVKDIASQSEDQLWWGQIEFPTSIDVVYITYDQYSGYSSTYYYDTEIYSSEDGVVWTPFAQFINEYGSSSSHVLSKAILTRDIHRVVNISEKNTKFSFGPVNAGDIVLLAVMHYDDVKVSPLWHFMRKSPGLDVRDTAKKQYISLFYKRIISDSETVTVMVTQSEMDALEIGAIVLNGDLVSECEVIPTEAETFYSNTATSSSFGFSKTYPTSQYIYLCQTRDIVDPVSANAFTQTNTSIPGEPKYNRFACQFMSILTDVSANTKDVTISMYRQSAYSGIPICVTRKTGNENKYRFLISRNNVLYKISNGQLVEASSSTPSAALFQADGFYPASLCQSLIQPTDSLLCWSAAGAVPITPKLIVSGTPTAHCITTDNKYFSDNTITGIETVKINGSADLSIAVSIDDGVTWKYYNGTAWAAATEEDSAMSTKAAIEGLTSVEWAALIGSNRSFKFKVKLKTADSYIENIKVSYKK